MDKLENVVRELAEIYRAGGVKTTRFTLTLPSEVNDRLDSIAGVLQMSKQELITRLLAAAVSDLEEAIDKSVNLKNWLGEND